MAFHVFLVFLILCLVWLWQLSWLHQNPLDSRVGTIRTKIQRLLKPRTPLDCPACRLSSTFSKGVGPAPLPVRPWREVKSRRGAPKRIDTQGFTCPNDQCPYFGITDAHIHALVGDGTHGRAEQIQTFRCQACRTTFSARRHTPLYRLKTPSQQVAMVLTALAEGLDPSAAERVFDYRQATITTWLNRAGEYAHTLHERSFRNLWLPHLQLDELRTRLRCSTQGIWLWLAVDPLTKIPPVLHLGPRTQNVAHMVIHWLHHLMVPCCLPLFTSDGLNVYFYALLGPFWTVARYGSPRAESTPVASGGRLDLWPGEKKLPATQADTGYACDAPGNKCGSQGRFARTGFLWTVEHRFYRAGESDCPSWRGSAGTSHLGHCPATSTAPGPSRVVASLLSLCTSPCITQSGAHAVTSARWQADGTALPTAYRSSGSGKNQPAMDSTGSALFSLAAGATLHMLSVNEVRKRCVK
jgi:transposase-like protein